MRVKKSNHKVVVVLPAYNAEQTLVETVSEMPHHLIDEIILVDDGSRDETAKLAKSMGLKVFRHKANHGYGANQKSCYTLALDRRADIIIMLHPDYQYDPKLIKYFIELISDNYFDVMLGSRIRTRKEALEGGMPAYKYLSNRILTLIENILSGQNLTEWHTGMRAYKRDVLEQIDFLGNSNDFAFDSQVLFQVVEKGYRIGEIPVPVRYFKEASSINFTRSLKYGFVTLKIALHHCLRRRFRRSGRAKKK